jgi:hypothetical protein
VVGLPGDAKDDASDALLRVRCSCHRQFIDVLEGPDTVPVSCCLQRMRDQRHQDVQLMRCDVVQERQFWT